MSEVQKPVVQEPVAAVEAVAPVVEAPAAAVKIEEPAAPVVAASTEPAAEIAASSEAPAAVEEAKKEFSGEGVLGYKAPGFIKKLAGFQKKFFWLGSEAVEPKHLSNYLRGEKPEAGNHNAAWASQTGKGLLFFSKLASDKATPAGIINLAEISEVTEDGSEFAFHAHSAKHVFQAASVTEAAEWVAALKAASVEAKASAETITGSDGYKESHSSLVKPLAAAAGVTAAAAAVVAKAEDKVEDKKEEKKDRTKSRSASRKRNSIFGGFLNNNKKEEEKKEVVESTPETSAAVEEPVVAAAPVDAPVAAAPAVEEAVAPVEAETAAATEEPKITVNKRNSVFARFSSFGAKKPAVESAPEVPAKDEAAVTEPIVATEAPVLPAVEATEPIVTPVEAAPATEEVVPEAKKEVKETKPSEKRKSSVPSALFSKLRQTVKGKTSPKADKAVVSEKTPIVEPKTEEIPAIAEPVETEATAPVKATEPIVPTPAATTTPVVAATA